MHMHMRRQCTQNRGRRSSSDHLAAKVDHFFDSVASHKPLASSQAYNHHVRIRPTMLPDRNRRLPTMKLQEPRVTISWPQPRWGRKATDPTVKSKEPAMYMEVTAASILLLHSSNLRWFSAFV